MKRIHLFLALVLATLTLGLAPSARAQRWDWNSEAAGAQFRSFDVFLNDHPKIAKKLWDKPQRVNDPGFLNGNKELKQWLEDHPLAAQAFHDDPVGFMEREGHFRSYGVVSEVGGEWRDELARFDGFLDVHPDIRHDLLRKPELVDRGSYLDRHPDLREFLYRHPGLREDLQEHPREFMEHEAHFGRSM